MRFDGAKLKELRGARKWDQHRLAEVARSHGAGITQSQVSRYENGKEPSGRNVVALAAALQIEPRELYGEDEAAVEAGPPQPMSFEDFIRSHVEYVLAKRVPADRDEHWERVLQT